MENVEKQAGILCELVVYCEDKKDDKKLMDIVNRLLVTNTSIGEYFELKNDKKRKNTPTDVCKKPKRKKPRIDSPYDETKDSELPNDHVIIPYFEWFYFGTCWVSKKMKDAIGFKYGMTGKEDIKSYLADNKRLNGFNTFIDKNQTYKIKVSDGEAFEDVFKVKLEKYLKKQKLYYEVKGREFYYVEGINYGKPGYFNFINDLKTVANSITKYKPVLIPDTSLDNADGDDDDEDDDLSQQN